LENDLKRWYELVRKDPAQLTPEEAQELALLSYKLNLPFGSATNGNNVLEKIGYKKLEPTGPEIISEEVTRKIMENHHIITVNDNILCYKEGIYQECEEQLLGEIESIIVGFEIPEKSTNHIAREVLGKIKRRTIRTSIQQDHYKLVFENGVVDIQDFVDTGLLEIHPHNPAYYVTHRIPHRIESLNDFVEKEYGLVYEESLHVTIAKIPIDVVDMAEKVIPQTWRIMSKWTDNPQILLEILGYIFYKSYPIHRAFMLVGEGKNGKSTYLNMVKYVVGTSNITGITLQQLAENRFAASELYNKLANIYSDLPKNPLRVSGTFKILTGNDYFCADRKFKKPICFTNYAKLIFSANELPYVTDQTYAFWRRWVLIKFPYTFPENQRIPKLLTIENKEIPKLITVSLYALRNVLHRGEFSGDRDYSEEWMKLSNSVYAFIKDMIEECSPEEDCFIAKDTLYSHYAEYCQDQDIEAYSQHKFTMELKRLIPKIRQERRRIAGERVRGWVGIRVKEGNTSDE